MKKFAVILCGCGNKDGSEIHESIATLLAIDKLGARYQCFSINEELYDIINHYDGNTSKEKRNQLFESSRIARGDILELSTLDPNDFDGLIFPGGLGVAKNFFTLVQDDKSAVVREDIKQLIMKFHKNKKYIGAICASTILLALAFKDKNQSLKISAGFDKEDVQLLQYFNSDVSQLSSSEIVVDEKNKLVSTPAYMNDSSIFEVYTGIEKLVNHMILN